MQDTLKQTRRILDVLKLKRQLAEKSVIELQLKDRALLARLEALKRPHTALPEDSADSLACALAVPAWSLWKKRQRADINKARAALGKALSAAQGELRVLIVQLDNVEKNYQALRQSIDKEAQARQSDAARDIWQTVQRRR